MKISTLNPLANTFIPSNPKASEMVSLGKVSTKSIAAKLIQDLIESKKGSTEKSITKEEIIVIVEKLIYLRCKANPVCDAISLKSYLIRKVPNVVSLKPLIPKKRDEKDAKPLTTASKIKSFDLSAFRVPKLSILLFSFWGLYRQEKALRPMLLLTKRPESLEDKIWSITSKDLKVWNSCAVENLCNCPPMFGYTIPLDFFGNPFNIECKCSNKSIHLNHYPDVEDGNEFVSMSSEQSVGLRYDPSAVFTDLEDFALDKDLEYYCEQFKIIVSAVCNLVSEDSDKTSDECEDFDEISPENEGSADAPIACDFKKSLWDSSKSDEPMAEIGEDDDCHQLLDAFPRIAERPNCEGVTLDIEEMIRRSLSTDSEAKEASEQALACDPPCSVWCQSSPKSTNRSSEALNILNDTTKFLLNGDGCISNQPLTLDAFEDGLNHSRRPYFKRSFSANDCDSYFESYKMAQAPTSTREALAFLRKDPINFFKRLKDRNDSWKDSDSGIVSHCSSNEDVFYDNEVNEEQLADDDSAPMWNFFSGEGSLWKPLPSSQQDEPIQFPHKRVRELRRQRSLN